MTRKERDAYRRSVVHQYRESGMSRKAFCAENGVALSSLDLWKRRYSNRTDDLENSAPSVVSLGTVTPARTGRTLRVSSTSGVNAELDLPATDSEIAAVVRAIASL
ncbi:hypothetical protein SAMN05920897_1292 [Alkalispirochaeta americana]|uniref:Transposase n=1 Tax=Alkalispirochaeta americana TaxID=159291 RepID=A0A1N6XQB7_9SPIO|nr:hypothetical protein SAMN05920897_1292 [Alkalispirochaeta americana]